HRGRQDDQGSFAARWSGPAVAEHPGFPRRHRREPAEGHGRVGRRFNADFFTPSSPGSTRGPRRPTANSAGASWRPIEPTVTKPRERRSARNQRPPSQSGGGTRSQAIPNRHAFIFATPSPAGPLSPISKNLCQVFPAAVYSLPSPRICEVATNGLRGESGITEVAPWWANVGAEAGKAESSALQRRMPESTPTRRRDEGPINCRLPAWTLVPPRPLLTNAAAPSPHPSGRPEALACPTSCGTRPCIRYRTCPRSR